MNPTGKEVVLLLGYRERHDLIVKTMEAYLDSRPFDSYGSHNSHGLYYEVVYRGRRFMFDLSPEDVPRSSREPGLLVIRSNWSHEWESPPQIGSANIFDEGADKKIDAIIGIQS